MSFTDGFRRQHDDILETVTELSSLLDLSKLEGNSEQAISLLAKLSGKLSAHLTMEDKVLYPKLYQHEDSTVRDTAKKFFDEMGGLSGVFKAYTEKWEDAASIDSEPDVFIDETKELFKALGNRVDRENNELYPLAD